MRVLPVIHVVDEKTTLDNCKIIFENSFSADGVFLISMHGDNKFILPLSKRIKQKYPNKLIGINLLEIPPIESLNISQSLGLDMTWTDNADLSSSLVTLKSKTLAQQLSKNPNHKFFASIAFKYQLHDENPHIAALIALAYGMIPTTSGDATGVAADISKVSNIRQYLLDNQELALASGLTPENITSYYSHIDYAIVSTGISKDFYNFDESLFNKFMENIRLASAYERA